MEEVISSREKPVVELRYENYRFKDTHLFSPAAAVFNETGAYTDAPEGTLSYDEFWDEEERRVQEGYTVNGVRITGDHYFYLNYCPIRALGDVSPNKKLKKSLQFPRFLDIDYHFFTQFELAELAGEGMIVGKARRKGFSFKAAALKARRYSFQRESICIISAYDSEYANFTMRMVLDMLTFIDQHTAWSKRRLVDRKDHIESGFIDISNGKQIKKGFRSQIITLSFQDNPDKGIGKTADLWSFEEAGKWPGLLDAYGKIDPALREGSVRIGTPLIWGTGGDMDKGTVDFEKMFYSPHAYGFRAFKNVWDEGQEHNACGFFVPDYMFKYPYIDEDGNSDIEAAKKVILEGRRQARSSNNQKVYENNLTQYPLCPREAFLRTSGACFPAGLLNAHLSYLQAHGQAAKLGQRGYLSHNGSTVIWNPDDKAVEAAYPYKPTEKEGCVVIYEHPYFGGNSKVPDNLYIAGCDPYSQDTSSGDSLGAIYIYKRFIDASQTSDIIVASYVGRPDRSETFYDTCILLQEYYNAKCLHENMFKDMKNHYYKRNKLYLLKDEPKNTIKSIISQSQVNRGKGVHMTKEIKRAGETWINDWLTEVVGESNELRLHTLQDKNLIAELIRYDGVVNSDRVMAFMMVMIQLQEDHKIVVKDRRAEEFSSSWSVFHSHFS
jgi:hypothetical protein